MDKDAPVLKSGSFYRILDDGDLILEDKTKRGLSVIERSHDEKLGVEADKGMIHDMDGIGHCVPIRWYFAKTSYDIERVMVYAKAMEEKYTKLRELTCPD